MLPRDVSASAAYTGVDGSRVALERLASSLMVMDDTLTETLMPPSDAELIQKISLRVAAMQEELAELKAQAPRLAQAEAAAEEAPVLRAQADALRAEVQTLAAKAEEAGKMIAGSTAASVDMLAALSEAKSAAAKMQARAFQAEMRTASKKAAAVNKPEPPPLTVQLNATKAELEKARAQSTAALQEKVAALQRVQQLAAALRLEEERSKKLSASLKEIGSLVGVGGFGGFLAMVMTDEQVIAETKANIATLKSSR